MKKSTSTRTRKKILVNFPKRINPYFSQSSDYSFLRSISKNIFVISAFTIFLGCTNQPKDIEYLSFKNTHIRVLKTDEYDLDVWQEKKANYFALEKTRIYSDGPNQGKNAYQLFREHLGEDAVEAPNLYEEDHQEMDHLLEETDVQIGDHFAFTLHLEHDGNKGNFSKKVQRNEVKVYNNSEYKLKGYQDKTFMYRWKVRFEPDTELSEGFCHFFQLKAKDGKNNSPMFTLSASTIDSIDWLQLRYIGEDFEAPLFIKLDSVKFREITGRWMGITCIATFSEATEGGYLSLHAEDYISKQEIISVQKENIDLWPGQSTSYIRPKWGMVRSIKHKRQLRSEEEKVRIADIEIYEVYNKKQYNQ